MNQGSPSVFAFAEHCEFGMSLDQMLWLWKIFSCVCGRWALALERERKKVLILEGSQPPMTVGEVILKDVWSRFSLFSFFGEGLALVKKTQLYSTFSPRENTNKVLL